MAPKPPDASRQPADGERRRIKRLSMKLSILVYGRSESGEPFHEETHTLQIGAAGCSFLLNAPLKQGQHLIIFSHHKDRQQRARVVYLMARKPNPTEVGVEFLDPLPDFWPVGFPPE